MINKYNNQSDAPFDLVKNNPSFEILSTEGNESFIDYIKWLGLDRDPNLVVLSSLHHYYYDVEEMKNVKTIINLIELNQIKQLRSFLHSIFHILSPKSNLIGCFFDNSKQNIFTSHKDSAESESVENGIHSRIPFLNMIYNLMDAKANKYMSRKNVTLLLEDHGFKVLDMTELKGLTYFHAKKDRTASN